MSKDKNQPNLFGDSFEELDWWKESWKDMPEFKSENLQPEFTILVHFRNVEDIKKFSKLLEQPVYSTTKSIWYPKNEITRYMDKRYVDKNELSHCCSSEILPYETPICSNCKDHCDLLGENDES